MNTLIPPLQTHRRPISRPQAAPVRFAGPSNANQWEDVPFVDLWGRDPSRITFQQQRGSAECFLLASIDSILHHPQAWQLLRRFDIKRNDDGTRFQVRFPNQNRPIEVTSDDLANESAGGHTEVISPDNNWLGVKLIEQAYKKYGHQISDTDDPDYALKNIFGAGSTQYRQFGNRLQVTPFDENPETFTLDSPQDVFRSLMGPNREDDTRATILCARRIGGNHIYSVRKDSYRNNQVILADPYDTSGRLITNGETTSPLHPLQTLTVQELLKKYELAGVSVPLTDDPPSPRLGAHQMPFLGGGSGKDAKPSEVKKQSATFKADPPKKSAMAATTKSTNAPTKPVSQKKVTFQLPENKNLPPTQQPAALGSALDLSEGDDASITDTGKAADSQKPQTTPAPSADKSQTSEKPQPEKSNKRGPVQWMKDQWDSFTNWCKKAWDSFMSIFRKRKSE